MNPWNQKPEVTYNSFFNLFKNFDLLLLFLFLHLIFIWKIIKYENWFYILCFLGIFIANLLMFLLGGDYGRWSSYFVLNTCFLAIYLFHQQAQRYNRKLMIILLSTIFWCRNF